MQQNLSAQIRKRLRSLVAGKTSLRSFQGWFVPVTWDIETAGDAVAKKLTYKIELLLAEYTSGHRTRSDLKDSLSALTVVSSSEVSASAATPPITSKRGVVLSEGRRTTSKKQSRKSGSRVR